MRIGNRLWLWSDTHFGHHNITVYQQRPGTHDVIMLDNWIRRIDEHATILHLGDLALGRNGNRKRWLNVLSRMPGRKALILGNHDMKDGEPLEDYEAAGFEVMEPFIFQALPGSALFPFGRIAFTHFPISDNNPAPNDEDWDINIHGHIHLNPIGTRDGTPFEGKRYINLSVENTDLAPVQLGNVLGRGHSRYDTEFVYDERFFPKPLDNG